MVRACMRRQADVWSRILTYGSKIGRVENYTAVSAEYTVDGTPVTARRVNGWYIVVCSNGKIYISNTGESWRVFGGGRSLYDCDVNDNKVVFGVEYSGHSYSRILKTADYVNWTTLTSYTVTSYNSLTNDDYTSATYCRYHDGYVYASINYEDVGIDTGGHYYDYFSGYYRYVYKCYSGLDTTDYQSTQAYAKFWKKSKFGPYPETNHQVFHIDSYINVGGVKTFGYQTIRQVWDKGQTYCNYSYYYISHNGADYSPPVNYAPHDIEYYDSSYYLITRADSSTYKLYKTTNFSSYTLLDTVTGLIKKLRKIGDKLVITCYGKFSIIQTGGTKTDYTPSAISGLQTYDYAEA